MERIPLFHFVENDEDFGRDPAFQNFFLSWLKSSFCSLKQNVCLNPDYPPTPFENMGVTKWVFRSNWFHPSAMNFEPLLLTNSHVEKKETSSESIFKDCKQLWCDIFPQEDVSTSLSDVWLVLSIPHGKRSILHCKDSGTVTVTLENSRCCSVDLEYALQKLFFVTCFLFLGKEIPIPAIKKLADSASFAGQQFVFTVEDGVLSLDLIHEKYNTFVHQYTPGKKRLTLLFSSPDRPDFQVKFVNEEFGTRISSSVILRWDHLVSPEDQESMVNAVFRLVKTVQPVEQSVFPILVDSLHIHSLDQFRHLLWPSLKGWKSVSFSDASIGKE